MPLRCHGSTADVALSYTNSSGEAEGENLFVYSAQFSLGLCPSRLRDSVVAVELPLLADEGAQELPGMVRRT